MNAFEQMKKWKEDPVSFVRDCFLVEPDAWQIDVLEAFNANNRIGMKACKGPGKEQPNDLVLYTPKGQVIWGDIKTGDKVFAIDGTQTTVIGIYPQGIKDIYRITFDDGTSTEAGLDHLWKVRGRTEKRHDEWSVLTTKDIMARGVTMKQGASNYSQFQIPAQGAANFPKKDLSIDPYLMGIWLGDGTKGRPEYTSIDDEISTELTSRGYVLRKREQPDRTPAYIIFNTVGKFREHDTFNKGSHERHIPEIYKTASIKQREDLLAGLMDSDGTIDKDDGACEYSTTSIELANDVAFLVRSLGGKSTVKQKQGRLNGVDHRICYRVRVTLNFNPFFLYRKARYFKPKTQDRYLCRTIKSIEKTRRVEATCIEVDHPEHCYLTNDFIVTHNTCVLAWVAWYFLATRPHPKIAATSISADNLSDGLWTEMAMWQSKSPFLKSEFQWTKTRIFNKKFHSTWYMSARTWPKAADSQKQADTLAGLHADYILFLLDEVGGIPDSVMAAAEAALATGIESKIVMAGNPTHSEGPLYRACTSERSLWWMIEITSDPDDPKRTPRVSIEWARQQIEKYGKNNPWVLVNVFGQFPPSSLNTLLGPEEIRAAMNRDLRPDSYQFSQRRLGVDVARFGDDATIIFPRQGLKAFKPVEMRNARTTAIAARIAEAKNRWNSEMEFIDDTGGFGGGVIDNLLQAGITAHGVHFSGKATENKYYNIRSEMWFKMADWIKKGGCIPNIPELVEELSVPQYTFHNGKFRLESKEHIKERLGRSPDYADALGLTFAFPEMPSQLSLEGRVNAYKNRRAEMDFDPVDGVSEGIGKAVVDMRT